MSHMRLKHFLFLLSYRAIQAIRERLTINVFYFRFSSIAFRGQDRR